MKKIKNISVFLVCLISVMLLFFATACGDTEEKPEPTPEKTVTRIAVTTKPTKISYIIGEKFDPTGMVVTAYYSDNTSEAVTDYKIDKTKELGLEDTSVTITYGSKFALLTIRVSIPVENKLNITDDESRVYTIEAEDLDYTYCTNSNVPGEKPNVENCGSASNMKSVGSLSVEGNTFGFGITSDVEADLTIVMRAAAVSFDLDIDTNIDFCYNDNYEYSEHVLDWDDEDVNFYRWEHVYFDGLKLNKGENKLVLNMVTGRAPNIDCFYVIVNPTGEEILGPGADIDPGKVPDYYESELDILSADTYTYVVEAENLTYVDCINMNDGTDKVGIENPDPSTNTSNGFSVSSLGVKGNRFGFIVNSAVSAKLDITFMLSVGAPTDQIIDNLLYIGWNGQRYKTDYVLVWRELWHQWEAVTIKGLELKEGENILDMLVIADGCPNIDCFKFEVNPVEGPEPEPEYATFANVETDEKNTYVVEAEALDYSKCRNSSDPASLPVAETPATETSGGKSMGGLGVAGNRFGLKIESKVDAALSVTFVLSSGGHEAQVIDDLISVTWNGEEIKTGSTLAAADEVGWHAWENITVDGLTLIEGENILEITVIGNGCPNIDCFKFEVSPSTTGTEEA